MTMRLGLIFAATAGLIAAGCANAPVQPGVFVSAPKGTVTTYQRNSSGSYGNFAGAVVWTQGERDWNGRSVVVSASPQAGTSLHDPLGHGLIANLNAAGQPTLSFDPPIAYAWPLEVGKAWSTQTEMTVHAQQRKQPLTLHYKVESYGDVSVPAGTFKAFKVVSTDSLGEVQQVWVVPPLGLGVLKRVSDRTPTHPMGAGHLEGALVSRTLPAP